MPLTSESENLNHIPDNAQLNYKCYYSDEALSLSGNAYLEKINSTHLYIKITVLLVPVYELTFQPKNLTTIPNNIDDIDELVYLEPNWTHQDMIVTQIISEDPYYTHILIQDYNAVYTNKKIWLHVYTIQTINSEVIQVYYFHRTGITAFLDHPDMKISFTSANFIYYEAIISKPSENDDIINPNQFQGATPVLDALIASIGTVLITGITTMIMLYLLKKKIPK